MTTEGTTRKLTAILSADVVGYSRLMAEDEVGTVQRLKSYRELIGVRVREHHGRVVDSPGDNLLAEFPSALDATRCAVEIQRVLKTRNDDLPEERRMEFRIGINLGDVMIDDERIYGDGVNIAARLESLAYSGGICISATVHEQVKNKLEIDYIDLGNQDVKNIAEPVHAYRILFKGVTAHKALKDKSVAEKKAWSPALIVALIIVAIGSILIWNYISKPRTPPLEVSVPQKATVSAEEPSIAVLPFVNMSNDPDNEYFSDGVSEEILNSLVKTNTLPVIARTSSFQFKGKNLSVQKIASELNVTHVIEGSVRKVGNQVRVTAQLADANTGIHLWSENYDRELVNILALQDEIAAVIVKEIQARVGGVSMSHEPRVRTQIVDELTYNLYLKARQLYYHEDPSYREALILFKQAVEKDTEFVDAWIGLAKAYLTDLGLQRMESIPSEAAPLAKAALQRALDIEPTNATALSLLGFIKALIEYKWAEGSALMERAVQLCPENAEILLAYAFYLGVTHQVGSMNEMEKTYRLDPFNQYVVLRYADGLSANGRQLDAQRIMESLMVTSQEANEFFTTGLYIRSGNLELAEQHHERAKEIWGTDHPRVMINEYRLAWLRGNDTLANSIEKELLQRMESEHVMYNWWGSADNLKRRYQLAYQQRQPHFVQSVLGNKPLQFTDEEWLDLREKMNISELGDEVLSSARPRTKEEEKALLEKRIKLDPSVIDQYVGRYKAYELGLILEISKKDGELIAVWPHQAGIPHRLIAVTENQFELLDIKNDTLIFLEHNRNDYDLEEIDGQIVFHYRRIENESQ